MIIEAVLPPTVVELTKDDYDILMELMKLFSSDEEGPMTNIDLSIYDGRKREGERTHLFILLFLV